MSRGSGLHHGRRRHTAVATTAAPPTRGRARIADPSGRGGHDHGTVGVAPSDECLAALPFVGPPSLVLAPAAQADQVARDDACEEDRDQGHFGTGHEGCSPRTHHLVGSIDGGIRHPERRRNRLGPARRYRPRL
jgi:hypothetical protein